MMTYLVAWNPERNQRRDLRELIDLVRVHGFHATTWGIGNTTSIRPGDCIFMICLGREPRGIFGSGWVISEIYERRHWNPEKRAIGQTSRSIDVRLDALLDPEHEPILRRERLNEGMFQKMHWDIRRSGITIPNDVAAALEAAWVPFAERLLEQRDG